MLSAPGDYRCSAGTAIKPSPPYSAAVFRTTVTLIKAHYKLSHLLPLVLRLCSQPGEREYSRLILKYPESVEAKSMPPYCLARCIAYYAAKHPDDKTVVEYTDYHNSHHNDHGGSNEVTWKGLHERIGGLGLRDAFLIATTSCAAQSLGSISWQADRFPLCSWWPKQSLVCGSGWRHSFSQTTSSFGRRKAQFICQYSNNFCAGEKDIRRTSRNTCQVEYESPKTSHHHSIAFGASLRQCHDNRSTPELG